MKKAIEFRKEGSDALSELCIFNNYNKKDNTTFSVSINGSVYFVDFDTLFSLMKLYDRESRKAE